MNKKKNWHIVLVLIGMLFLCASCWTRTAIGFLAPSEDSGNDEENPPVTHADMRDEREESEGKKNYVQQFLSGTDAEIKEADSNFLLPARKKLSSIDLYTTFYSLGEISSSQVVKGEENWLFYKTTSDGDPIADYEGRKLYSEKKLNTIADAVSDTQQDLEKRGIQLYLFVAPNKENIYYSYMPPIYQHADVSRTDLLVKKLQEQGAPVVFPREELLAEKDRYPLYYHYDTHWNQLGAYLGTGALLEKMGIGQKPLDECHYDTTLLKENYHFCATDDLALLAGLRNVYDDEEEYQVRGTQEVDWTYFRAEQEAPDHHGWSLFQNDGAPVDKTVLLVGDSFRSAMVPSLSATFKNVYVCYRPYYDPAYLDDFSPAYLVLECVERYSGDLANVNELIGD